MGTIADRFLRTLVDVDALREHLLECCGTAAFGGFPVAVLDVADIERMSGEELYQKAEKLGVDLRRFVIEKEGQ